MHYSLRRILCATTIIRLALTASVPLPTLAAEAQILLTQNLFLVTAVQPRPVDWFKGIGRDADLTYQLHLPLQLDA